MAPSVEMASADMASVVKRYDGCPSNYYRSGSYCYPNSSWYWWGRWVLAGVIVVVVLVIIMMLGCVSARRRRRRGMAPMYGTGWMGGKNGHMQNPQGAYNNNNHVQYGPPPPQYSANPLNNQTTGTTFSPNDGYYGGHNGNYVQPPQNTYTPNRAADPVYEPPPGPPPSKIA